MPESLSQVQVRLLSPKSESAFFLVDVQTRLEAVARRVGATIIWSETDSLGELKGALTAAPPSALREETGTHRAQFVPSNSESGAVVTAFVEVWVQGAEPKSDVVRNYNYPLRQCKSFRSGATHSLDDVLAGAG
jgi:protein subunit release factor A